MDPNAMAPSPPSSIYSSPSNTSIHSSIACSSSRRSSQHSNSQSKTSKPAPQLPYIPQLAIFKYIQTELEKICFSLLKRHAPTLLAEREIDCAEMLELNFACRKLLEYCPQLDIDWKALNDWIPDLRHAVVYRDRMTATAACKTVHEAGQFALSVGEVQVGRKCEFIAMGMDMERREMLRRMETLGVKVVTESVKEVAEQGLRELLTVAREETPAYEVGGGWVLSDEVKGYSVEEKMEENPWSDPRAWGHGRNRKYVGSCSGSWSSGRESSESPPRGRSTEQSWRARKSEPVRAYLKSMCRLRSVDGAEELRH